jgi:hypothetical protein
VFFTQLGQFGLLVILCFFGYLVSLLQFIWKRRNRPSYRLALAVYFLYLSLMLTQGGMWFELDVFMVLVYVKLEFENMMYKKFISLQARERPKNSPTLQMEPWP